MNCVRRSYFFLNFINMSVYMDLRMCMLRKSAPVCMCIVSVFARYS